MLTYTLNPSHIACSAKYWPMVFSKTHTHTFWEILFVCKGTLINSLNKKETEMKKFDVVLIHPKDVHKLYAVPGSRAEYYNLTIEESFFIKFCSNIYEGLINDLNNRDDLYITLSAHRHEKLLNLINFAVSMSNEEDASKYYNIVLSYLLPEFIPLHNTTSPSVVNQVIKIMSHPNNMNLTIKEIAQQVGYSPEHLIRLFQKKNQPSPNHIFLQLKMEHAKLLLQQTNLSIEDIAASIGISSLPHFYHKFKQFHNATPLSIRKGKQ